MKWDLLVSQFVPAYPGTQLHVYSFTKSLHVAPFKQGLVAHSLISIVTPIMSVSVLNGSLSVINYSEM